MTDCSCKINTIPYSLKASAQRAEPNSTVSLCWFWIKQRNVKDFYVWNTHWNILCKCCDRQHYVLLEIEPMSKTIKFYSLYPCLTLFKRKYTAKLARLTKMFEFIIHWSETALAGLNTTWITRFKRNQKRMGSFKTYVGNEPPHTQGAPVVTNFWFWNLHVTVDRYMQSVHKSHL